VSLVGSHVLNPFSKALGCSNGRWKIWGSIRKHPSKEKTNVGGASGEGRVGLHPSTRGEQIDSLREGPVRMKQRGMGKKKLNKSGTLLEFRKPKRKGNKKVSGCFRAGEARRKLVAKK